MQIPHDSFVLVADGRKSLFFRNEGDADFPNLAVEREGGRRQSRPITSRRATLPAAPPTRSAARWRRSISTQLEEDRFAAATAAMLKERALSNDYEALVVVAPPATLGELRKHYHKEVEKRLVAEVPKDLVNVPVAEIEKILPGPIEKAPPGRAGPFPWPLEGG